MKINVKLKILLIAAVPLLVAAWFMFGTMLNKYAMVKEMDMQAPASAFLVNTGKLVQEFHKERSLSLLYALDNDSLVKDKMLGQYQKTDNQIDLFTAFSESFKTESYSPQIAKRLKKTLNTVQQIGMFRSLVSSQSISARKVVEEYSKPINLLFSSVSMIVSYGTNSKIIQARSALVNYMQAKESLSLKQAVLTRAFKKDSFEDGDYRLFSSLDSQESTFIEIFISLATDDQLKAFSLKQSDPIMTEKQHMHDIAIEKGVASESTIHLVNLTKEFGFGGAIHAFKNYVLRKDENYADAFEVSYQKTQKSISMLNDLFKDDKRNLRYLKKIVTTIEKYHKAIPKVRSLIEEGLNADDIDKKIKISDKAAIISLGALINSSLSGNFSIDPIIWFDNVTNALSLMVEMEELLVKDLNVLDDELGASAWNSLIMMAAIISIVFIVVIVTVLKVTRNIVEPLDSTVQIALSIANGDLTGKLDVQRSDEIGLLANAINNMADNLKSMIQNINTTTTQLAHAANEVKVITTKTTNDVTQQQSELMSISTAMNEMNNTVLSIAENAIQAKIATENAYTESNNGQKVVTLTADVISELSDEVDNSSKVIKELAQDSENIGNVLDVIRNIAEQTNLLALNAAIEAARAGEQGRGFAVVADEVRVLASRTQEATLEIQEMIERLQSGSDRAVKAMAKGMEKTVVGVEHANKAREMLGLITISVSDVGDITSSIATATEEQTATVNEIDRSISSINTLAEETANGAEITSKSISELAGLANNLQQIVGEFKV